MDECDDIADKLISNKNTIDKSTFSKNPEVVTEIAIMLGEERAFNYPKEQDRIYLGYLLNYHRYDYDDRYIVVTEYYKNSNIISFGEDPIKVLEIAFEKGYKEVYLVPNIKGGVDNYDEFSDGDYFDSNPTPEDIMSDLE